MLNFMSMVYVIWFYTVFSIVLPEIRAVLIKSVLMQVFNLVFKICMR